MTISIIVPIYNTPKNLLQTFLESLSNLKNSSFEFILINDGSDPYVFNICQIFFYDKRFRYYYQENKGVSVARNYGIEMAQGEWLFFADPDDFIGSSLDTVFENIKNSKEDLMLLGYDKIEQYNKVLKSYNISQLIDVSKYKKEGPIYLANSLLKVSLDFSSSQGFYLGTPWAKLVRKSFVLDNKLYFDKKLLKRQDALFMLDLFLANPVVGFIDKIVYSYRVDNEKSITKNYNRKIQEVYLYLIREIDKRNKNELLQEESVTLYTYDLMKEIINLDYCNVKNVNSYKERKLKFMEFRNDVVVNPKLTRIRLEKIKMWKKILYWFVYHKNFYMLNGIYFYRQLKKELSKK